MSLRWRADGRLLCAARTEEEPNDTYIDDRLHYQLSIISRAIISDPNEEENSLWYWVHSQNAVDGRPDQFLMGKPQLDYIADKDKGQKPHNWWQRLPHIHLVIYDSPRWGTCWICKRRIER